MPDKERIQQAVDALWEIYEIRNSQDDSEQAQIAVIKALADLDDGPHRFGGIRKTVADAIARAFLNTTLEDVLRRSGSARP